ncbi:MAG: hypothetical protein KDD53_03075 [Bdellovibrionales bacterium]|nr:hypothetical protein [Bdellovibrionales bacterium]
MLQYIYYREKGGYRLSAFNSCLLVVIISLLCAFDTLAEQPTEGRYGEREQTSPPLPDWARENKKGSSLQRDFDRDWSERKNLEQERDSGSSFVRDDDSDWSEGRNSYRQGNE